MKKIVTLLTLCILLLSAFSFQLSAQQLPLYSQYMFNTLEINPAYAGFKESMQFTSIFRKQFNGIKKLSMNVYGCKIKKVVYKMV